MVISSESEYVTSLQSTLFIVGGHWLSIGYPTSKIQNYNILLRICNFAPDSCCRQSSVYVKQKKALNPIFKQMKMFWENNISITFAAVFFMNHSL